MPVVTLSSALLLLVGAAAPHPITQALPGPDTPSTSWVLERLTHWPKTAAKEEAKDGNPLLLECLVLPKQPETIGIRQVMVIAAGMQEVASVVEDFAHYAELFPDLVDVHKVKGTEDANRFRVAWEQHVPVFFIPNVKFETSWLIERASERISYRYKLKERGEVRATDGLIVLEALGPNQTRYTEYDFIEAGFGPLSEATAWSLTLSGTYRSDVALKLKVEHPTWSYPKIKEEAEKLLARFPTDGCYERRRAREP